MSDKPAPDHLDLKGDAPSLATLIAFPSGREPATTVPAPLSSFVGRQHDLVQVLTILADSNVRLLTLTGPGGMGKTRLALAAAAGAGDLFSDGVAFVALDSARHVAEVIPAIAQTLGLHERNGQDQHAQLRAFLERKNVLLVLDNFEQILAAGPGVVDLLMAARGVTALVTSRAPLRVDGERVLPVPPLTLASEQATAAELLASGAGRLFVERARARDAAFALDDQVAPIIADICMRLDGLPLAIELAAAHANMLAPSQLHARLERRLPFLTRGLRNAPPRHGAMRNTIAWSYDLLTGDAKHLFRQLAVFVDGSSLPAAEWMCDGMPRPASDTFDLVASLVDHSLLVRERGADREPRFRMLETIREYGLEQLAAEGEEDGARSRHAQYFLNLVRTLRPLASMHARRAPLDQLLAERANLQEALRWLDARGPAAEFAELVAALALAWYSYGSFREGEGWLERAMARRDQASIPDQARLSIGYAGVYFARGDIGKSKSCLEQGLSLLGSSGDPADMALALILRGAVLISEGSSEEAETPIAAALALADHVADPVLRAAVAGRALANLGGAALAQLDFARATAFGEEALRIYEGSDLDLAESLVLMDLGAIALNAGDDELAAERWHEAIALMNTWGDMGKVADALSGIGCVASSRREPRAALLLFGAADAARERMGVALIWPTEVNAAERSLTALRNELGASIVDMMLAEGRALSLSEAVEVAAGVVQPAVTVAEAHGSNALTRRESEVLQLLGEGRTDQEIADRLFLSRRTVSWHVRSILAKLDATSRDAAIASARGRDLL